MAGYAEWLKEREAAGELRRLRPLVRIGPGRVRDASGAELLDFSSNDYLALSFAPELADAAAGALRRFGTGSGAARLMSGDLELFHELEETVAAWQDRPAALLFGSGFAANTGVISALVGRGDTVIADRLCHASIYDGVRLSRARLLRFRHNDCNHLEECLSRARGRALVVVESVYSMDGDLAPLEEIVALKEQRCAMLMVDEAHAVGVFGPAGSGRVNELGLGRRVDVVMGTFGKALGSCGAFVAGTEDLVSLLVNRARSFIYSTAMPPAVAAAGLAAVRLLGERPDLGKELLGRAGYFKERLAAAGIGGRPGASQIVPVLVGESGAAVALADGCRERGLWVTAVRPPTVERGRARIRLSVTLGHSREDLAAAAKKLAAAATDLGIRPRLL